MSRIKPKEAQTKIFMIDDFKKEVINFVQVGIDDK